jgi:cytochrome c-type biogenesis protein CcmH
LKQILILAFAIAVMMGSSAAYAVQPDEIMSDPIKEARARDLSRELRCMVCQNQSIDDSEAPLARDLRLLVRERIAAGDSDAQVHAVAVGPPAPGRRPEAGKSAARIAGGGVID